MGLLKVTLSASSRILLLLFLFWAAKSAYTYFFLTEEDAVEAFRQATFTPFGVPDAHLDLIRTRLFDSYFGQKQAVLRAHVASALVFAILLTIQFTPAIRRKAINVHRNSGRLFLLFALVNLPFLCWLIWNSDIGPIGVSAEMPVPLLILLFGGMGYKQVKDGDIPAHRSSMIMCAAGFFFFGVQRLALVAGHWLHTVYGPTSSPGPFQDLNAISPEEYMDRVFGPSVSFSFWFTYGIAGAVAYKPRLPRLGKRAATNKAE